MLIRISALVITLSLVIGGITYFTKATSPQSMLCIDYRVTGKSNAATFSETFRADLRSGTVTEANTRLEQIPLEKEIYPYLSPQSRYGVTYRNFALLGNAWVKLNRPVPPYLLAQQEGVVPFYGKPQYSPDGQHLAYGGWDSDGMYHIGVTDRNGHNRLNYLSISPSGIAKYPPSLGGWSADGNYFTVVDYSMMSWTNYYFVRTDNGTFADMAHPFMPGKLVAEAVAWSPYGHVFAALNYGPPHTLTLATPAEGVMTSFPLPLDTDYDFGGSVGWSADGHYVSASYNQPQPDGTVRRIHTILKVQGLSYSDIQENGSPNNTNYTNYWFGNRFISGRYNPATNANDLVAFDPATNHFDTLATGVTNADYNRESQRLAVQTAHKDGLTLTLMNADGSHQVTVIQGAAAIRFVRWWEHNGLTVFWTPSSTSAISAPVTHLTWISFDGQHTGTSAPIGNANADDVFWLKDGVHLFYTTQADNVSRLHLVDLLTGRDDELFPNAPTFVAISPSQDLVAISFLDSVANRQVPGAWYSNIYVLSLQTHQLTPLTGRSNLLSDTIWSLDESQIAVIEQDPSWQHAWIDTFTPDGVPLKRVSLPSVGGEITLMTYTICP